MGFSFFCLCYLSPSLFLFISKAFFFSFILSNSMNSINLIFYSHTCFQFSNRKSPTTISFWELALVAPCCSLICEMLLFEWIKSTRLGLECSSPQKSVHYIPEHMFYCSAALTGHWINQKNRSVEPLAIARCGVRGHGFNSGEASLLSTSSIMR